MQKKKKSLKDFFDTVKIYSTQSPIENLTPKIVSDFIDRIEVFEKEKIDGEKKQKINIYFKGIGLLRSEFLP